MQAVSPPPFRRKYRGVHHQASSVRKGQRQRYWYTLTRMKLVLQLLSDPSACQRRSFFQLLQADGSPTDAGIFSVYFVESQGRKRTVSSDYGGRSAAYVRGRFFAWCAAELSVMFDCVRLLLARHSKCKPRSSIDGTWQPASDFITF